MRDSLLEREARETEPAGVVNGHHHHVQLRERERERRDEPREHVRRVARVGFQSRVQVRTLSVENDYSIPT